MLTRNQIRQQMRQRRASLTQKQQQQHARSLARNLTLSRHFRQSKHIAFYLPENGEIDPGMIMKRAWQAGKKVYLPVLSPYENSLFFAPYTPQSKMRLNHFGIAEPHVPLRYCKRAHQLQMILMPLVSFDEQGNGLGMGGGFYDRTLHFRHHQNRWCKPRLVGIAHECQKYDQLPVEHWDIPLDAIATEQSIYRIKR